ncbi:MAG TPA: LLM class flavin-dependent oxidoreductase [Roseiflexaceae bacterium]|nr:LLM class flavin-dependent oxidoreductase [Roseiflexaceae bacterium]
MKYGFVLPFGDARTAAEYASDAERAGWDGFFVAETVWGVDAWVSLTAAAMRTEHIRLGTLLTPVSRRRPWKLASETATLDQLSGGRVILVAGLGALDTGFAEFGEVTDRRTRAELLDEGLEIICGLWRGQPFSYAGKHYSVRPLRWTGIHPVQQPRIPIWVVGAWPRPKSVRRALRYDGILPAPMGEDGTFRPLTHEDVRAIRDHAAAERPGLPPLDIVVEGTTPVGDPAGAAAITRAWEEAGATWWIESMWDTPGTPKQARATVRRRLLEGPPRG